MEIDWHSNNFWFTESKMRMNAPPVMNGGETNKEKEDEKVKAVLVLEDGTRYEGYSFGAMSNTSGEIGLFILFYTEFIYVFD